MLSMFFIDIITSVVRWVRSQLKLLCRYVPMFPDGIGTPDPNPRKLVIKPVVLTYVA